MDAGEFGAVDVHPAEAERAASMSTWSRAERAALMATSPRTARCGVEMGAGELGIAPP
ncbi:hypothetical protein [Sorangium sp. So ce131]|uniref:hypothetical protein n=1 Tax=Sorangium sp. So ce131 TaxID=3133282 RepID=UPI003F60F4AA